MLEAYCRGCGAYLKSLNRQVEALDKLTKLTDLLKTEREVRVKRAVLAMKDVVVDECFFTIGLWVLFLQDDQVRILLNNVQQADYLESLQNLPSPLNNSHILGTLQ